ncbi:MAG: radical SAM protein [Desulfofustis sp.]|nr:radical SAM protein [Desulfofustis sp.]
MLVIPFFIQHQGCPHHCLFCDQWSIAGRDREVPGSHSQVDRLRRTIDTWLGYRHRRRSVQLAFFGGSFTCLAEDQRRLLLEAAQPYLRRGALDSIRVSTRPDCIDDEIVDFLRAYGVRTVEIGAQSMNDAVLQQAERGHCAADTEAAVGVLARHGCSVGLQLMVGLPGETTASFLTGVRRAIEMKPAFVRLYPTLVLAGTGLAELYRRGPWQPLGLAKTVALAGRARQLLAAGGIPVIRLGLQPTPELQAQVLAGPYHPAFGELVSSRDWYLTARRLLRAAGTGRTVELTISPRDQSAFVGSGQINLKRLGALPESAALSVRLDRTLTRGSFFHAIR